MVADHAVPGRPAPADYVMAMGMLRGLRRRVEAHRPPAASGRDPLDQAAYEIAAVGADQVPSGGSGMCALTWKP